MLTEGEKLTALYNSWIERAKRFEAIYGSEESFEAVRQIRQCADELLETIRAK
jgi:hypothetical protein